jgi:hypothetical protein
MWIRDRRRPFQWRKDFISLCVVLSSMLLLLCDPGVEGFNNEIMVSPLLGMLHNSCKIDSLKSKHCSFRDLRRLKKSQMCS